jgi:hypothetical protein
MFARVGVPSEARLAGVTGLTWGSFLVLHRKTGPNIPTFANRWQIWGTVEFNTDAYSIDRLSGVARGEAPALYTG